MSFVTFAERAVAPPIKKVLAYKAPNGVMKHYRMTIEWSTEHDTYSKFLHNLDIHNDFIVQRVAVQFPDLVSVTNVDGMTDDDIEKTKAHHIWEKVQYRASMHFHVDTRPHVLSKYPWGDALLKEFSEGVPESTQMKNRSGPARRQG